MTTQGGKWITEKDWRVDAYVCLGVLRDTRGTVGCRALLTVPFYQPYAVDAGTVFCRSCAYLHLKVSPPESPKRRGYKAASVEVRIGVDPAFSGDMAAIATVDTKTGRVVDMKYLEPTADCGHAPSDETCRCWGVWQLSNPQFPSSGGWCNAAGDGLRFTGNRREANVSRCKFSEEWHAYTYEVRRYTEVVAPAPVAKAKPTWRCGLSWCDQSCTGDGVQSEAGTRCCGERCASYLIRKEKIDERLEKFLWRMGDRKDRLPQREAEVDWAIAQHGRELAPVEAQFRALRLDRPAHSPPVQQPAGEAGGGK